jgi:hypothetical protein
MSILVKNILELQSFKNAEVLVNKKYLDKVVSGVYISDNPYVNGGKVISQRGDFYISSFYFAKNSLEDMLNYIQAIINTGSCGLCLTDEHIKTLPHEVISLCEKHKFPIIMVSKEISFSEIIMEITESIIFSHNKSLLENRISFLLNGSLTDQKKSSIFYEINPDFYRYSTYLYATLKEYEQTAFKNVIHLIHSITGISALEYKKGLLVIISYDNEKFSVLQRKIQFVVETIQKNLPNSSIGISNNFHTPYSCNKGIKQSLTCIKCKDIFPSTIIYYQNLGVEKLLLAFHESEEIEEFYNQILQPILDFDKKNKNSALLETLIIYMDNKKNMQKTAKILFLHENTIRYRLSKAQELIEANSLLDNFYENLSIALKIYKLRDLS